MRTIPRNYPWKHLGDDRRERCAYCSGVFYLREMTRLRDGSLKCPQSECAHGRELCDMPDARQTLAGFVVTQQTLRQRLDALGNYYPEDDMAAANWSTSATRFYAVDPVSGSDGNVGYSDVSMAAAGLVAVRTIARLLALIPSFGAGRTLVVAIKAGTFAEPLDLRLVGYASVLVRGTTDFSNSASDKITAGGAIALAGPNADSSFTVAGGGSASAFSVSAGTLTAETALIGKRFRFAADTTTAALRNVCGFISANSSSQITAGALLGASPAAGDRFFIEQPGVAVTYIKVSSLGSGASRTVGTYALYLSPHDPTTTIVGVKTTSDGTSSLNASIVAHDLEVDLAFCETTGESTTLATTAVVFFGCERVCISDQYRDETNTVISVGSGLRTNSAVFWSGCDSVLADSIATFATVASTSVTNCGEVTIYGQGGYAAGPVFVTDSGRACTAFNSGSLSSIGRRNPTGSAEAVSRMSGVITLTSSNLRVGYITLASAANVVLLGDCSVIVTSVTGGGGLASALNCSSAFGASVSIASGNTAAGSTGAVLLAGGAYAAFADFATNSLIDSSGNEYIGAAGRTVSSCVAVTNSSGGSLSAGAVVRSNGTTGQVTSAQGDSATNAKFLGVMVTTTASAAVGYAAVSGAVWSTFASGPTVGGIAYLSTATPAVMTTTAPTNAATNQKLRLGTVSAASGSTGQVRLAPENLAVTADGNA